MLDHAFYRNTYPDISELEDSQLEEHWQSHGQAEGRASNRDELLRSLGELGSSLPEDFDWHEYIAINPGLAGQAWTGVSAAEHFVTKGRNEGRFYLLTQLLKSKGLEWGNLPEDFSWEGYLQLNPDVHDAGFRTRELAIAHYLEYGVGRSNRMYRIDADFYANYYLRKAPSDDGRFEASHWRKTGQELGWHPTIADWLSSFQLDVRSLQPLPDFDVVQELNGLSTFGFHEFEAVVLGYDSSITKLFREELANAQFWRILADWAALQGDEELSEQYASRSLEFEDSPIAYQQLGDAAVRQKRTRAAVQNYDRAIGAGSLSVWPLAHNVRLKTELKDFAGAFDDALRLTEEHAGSPVAADAVSRLGYELWAECQRGLEQLVVRGRRRDLIAAVEGVVEQQALLRTQWVSQGEWALPPVKIRRDKVLIVADMGLPQTLRYRVHQKREQLESQGYSVNCVDWREATEAHKDLPWYDVVIVYRAPAWPDVVKLITDARAAGKVTFYEIDDMIFDVEYPPPMAEYAGLVGIREYSSLVTGMAAYRAAAQLCDYAISSTQPLVDRLSELVATGQAYLHRNGLDSHNPESVSKPVKNAAAPINIFYGSGTKAHNSDFIELVVPALSRLLSENPRVNFVAVGHLQLPEQFLTQHASQVRRLPLTKSIGDYMELLKAADINVAVLKSDALTDGKSELKWFEAANFGIPSVVSDTANYLDVIDDGQDGLIARTPEDWYEALRALVEDPERRHQMGETARQRILKDYSIDSLGGNISQIIEAASDDFERRRAPAGSEVLSTGVGDEK